MKIEIPVLFIFLVVAGNSFAQDTTGGTRPGLVIPLHNVPAKPTPRAVPLEQKVYSPAENSVQGMPINATDRKLRIAAAAKQNKKYGRKVKRTGLKNSGVKKAGM
ncbi:MAG: hypothetical protein WKF88_03170 [Ferruginibacter sp.]